MKRWPHGSSLLRNRKSRRDAVLRKMAAMRAAKERKRISNPIDHEPKMVRTTCLSIGFRDDLTGEAHWLALKSARQARRLAGVLLQFYIPGRPI